MAMVQLLTGQSDQREFSLDQEHTLIGRSTMANITISDMTVSAKHAVIIKGRKHHDANVADFYIQDLDSSNGTYVDGRRLERRQQLLDGDLIKLGWCTVRFLSSDVINQPTLISDKPTGLGEAEALQALTD